MMLYGGSLSIIHLHKAVLQKWLDSFAQQNYLIIFAQGLDANGATKNRSLIAGSAIL